MAIALKKRFFSLNSAGQGKSNQRVINIVRFPTSTDNRGKLRKQEPVDLEKLPDELSKRYHFLSGLIRECEEIVELNKAGQRREAAKLLSKTLGKIKADAELRDAFKNYFSSNVAVHLSAVSNMIHVLKTNREAVKHQITLKIQKQVDWYKYLDIFRLRDHLKQRVAHLSTEDLDELIDKNRGRYQKHAKRVVIGSTLFYLGTATGMMMLGASTSMLVALAVGVAIAQYSITSAMYYSMRKQNTKIVKKYVSRACSTYVGHMEVFDRAIEQYQHHISWVKEQLKIRHIDDLRAVRATATGIFEIDDLPLFKRGIDKTLGSYVITYFTYEDHRPDKEKKEITLLAELSHLMAILKSDESNLRTALKFLASKCDEDWGRIYEKHAEETLARVKARIDAMWGIREQLFEYDENKYKQQDAESKTSTQMTYKQVVGYSTP